MSLQKRDFRHHKSDVVQRSHELRPVEAARAGVDSEADRVEEMTVDFEWDVGGKQWRVEASELGIVGECKSAVVLSR